MTAWSRSLLWAALLWLAGCPLARSAPAIAPMLAGARLAITQPTLVCDNPEGRVRCVPLEAGSAYDFDAQRPPPATLTVHEAPDDRRPGTSPQPGRP